MPLEDQRIASPSPADKAAEISSLLLPAAVLLLPLTSNTVAEGAWSGLTMLVATLLIVLLASTAFSAFQQRKVPASPATATVATLTTFMLMSFVISSSASGAILVTFALGATSVTLAIAMIHPSRLPNLVALPLLITSSLQAILVIAQTLTDRAVGLTLLEPGAELKFIDGLLRPQGTMHHVYEPAALALLAAGVALATTAYLSRRWLWAWTGGAGLAGATIGLTHSRAALLGLLLMLPFVVAGMQRRLRFIRVVGGALLIGFLVAAAFTGSAWVLRGDQSVVNDLDDASLGRITLIEQAVTMTMDNPLVGVGPGRYMETIRSEYELDEDYPYMVHNVTLAISAENGIAAALVVSLLIAWAVARAVRSGPLPAALAVAPAGFLVFDVLHYNRPVGLIMTAIWLGMLHAATSRGSISAAGQR